MQLPFKLPPSAPVLVAGAGGGHDCVCAVPVARSLQRLGHPVQLANFSTGPLETAQNVQWVLPNLARVDGDTTVDPPNQSFPELHLARWWRQTFSENLPVWTFPNQGVVPLTRALEWLVQQHALQAVVLVDGGVDGLFLGNEHDTATPSIDAVTMVATYKLTAVSHKYYVFTAFGSEGWQQSVRHHDALQRIGELIRRKAMLGVAAALPGDEDSDALSEAVRTINRATLPIHHSIIANSITTAMSGHCGFQEVAQRAQGAPVWVSPLTLLYWFFRLEPMVEMKPFLSEVLESETVGEMHEAIERVRQTLGVLPRRDIPI